MSDRAKAQIHHAEFYTRLQPVVAVDDIGHASVADGRYALTLVSSAARENVRMQFDAQTAAALYEALGRMLLSEAGGRFN